MKELQTKEEYLESAGRFNDTMRERGSIIGFSPLNRPDVVFVSLLNDNIRKAFFNGETLGDMFHNIRLHDVSKKEGKKFFKGFSVDPNPSESEIHFIISGAKLEGNSLVYTGKIEDFVSMKQESKKKI